MEIIINCNFWNNLEDMIDILQLHNDHQVMFVSENEYQGYHIKR